LGLVTAEEGGLTDNKRNRLADLVERSVDLDGLLELAAPLPELIERTTLSMPRASSVRIGVAHDAAFYFYYRDNLALLKAAGAELVYWSPLTDNTLPVIDGLYVGGGYPELHASALGANKAIRNAMRVFGDEGRPIYAEGARLMYLAEALENLDGTTHPMVGLLPATVRMRPQRLSLSYTEVTLQADSPLGPSGTVARGQEFHFSSLDPVPASVSRVYRLCRRHGDECDEGYQIGNALLSYVHLHFASNPRIAESFVTACAEARTTRRHR